MFTYSTELCTSSCLGISGALYSNSQGLTPGLFHRNSFMFPLAERPQRDLQGAPPQRMQARHQEQRE